MSRRRRRNPDMGSKDWLVLAGIGLGGYLLYRFFGKAKTLATQATAPIAAGIANAIVSLTAQPQMDVLGNIILPDGSDGGPLSATTVYSDNSGGVFVKTTNGDVYRVGKSDANGNWPVTFVQSNYQLPVDFGLSDLAEW
jgi:hypothetical protein